MLSDNDQNKKRCMLAPNGKCNKLDKENLRVNNGGSEKRQIKENVVDRESPS